MREYTIEKPALAGSVIFLEDGSMLARYGYEHAIRLLYEYENSGVTPEGVRTDRLTKQWERYTEKTPGGLVCTRRGWECILGRLFNYECSGLTPEQWRWKYQEGAASAAWSR